MLACSATYWYQGCWTQLENRQSPSNCFSGTVSKEVTNCRLQFSLLFVSFPSGVRPWHPQSCTTAPENEHSRPCMPPWKTTSNTNKDGKICLQLSCQPQPSGSGCPECGIEKVSEAKSELSREEYHDRTVTATMDVGRTASTRAILAVNSRTLVNSYICRFLPRNPIMRGCVTLDHSLTAQENCHSNFHWRFLSPLISNG